MEIKKLKKYLKPLFLWTVLGLLIGIACGVIGALFSKSISFVTLLREKNSWLLYFLPIAGLLSVAVYRILKIGHVGAVYIFESAKSDKKIPKGLSVGMFIASSLTHLCGGSAGKEGSAIQIGGGIAETVARILKLDSKKQNTLVLCGMAALFSAVFGTPLAAAVFSLEVVRVSKNRISEFYPCIIASLSAFAVAQFFKVEAERFEISIARQFNMILLLKILLISLLAAVIGYLFCKTLRYTSVLSQKILKNDYLRIFIGGCFVVLITYFIGNNEYNGSSIEGIYRIFEQETVKNETFVLKLILTAITMGFGYKGGEIIPSLFIGSAFGSAASVLLGIPIPLGAVVGMAALFCAVTKCPVATVFLFFELFSGKALLYIILATVIGRFCSFRASLYGDVNPIFKHKKITD